MTGVGWGWNMSARRPVIGVMGAGDGATVRALELAEACGEAVARRGWVLLTGGRDAGVMQAASRGAKRVEGSLTVGILPDDSGGASPFVDLAIFTGMGNARNAINVLSSDVVIAVGGGGPGTASEVALALKSGKPVVLLAPTPEAQSFFRTLGTVHVVAEAASAVELTARIVEPR